MGATASADTVSEPSGEPAVTQPTSAVTGSSTSDTTASAQPKSTTDQPTDKVTGASTDNTTADAKPVQPTADQPAGSVTSGVQSADNSAAPKNDVSAQSAPTALPKQPANVADTQPTATTSGAQPVLDTAVESGNNESAAQPTGQTVDPSTLMTNFAVDRQNVDGTRNSDTTTVNSTFEWTIHYTDEAGKALAPDSVISHEYTRTDTGDRIGNWSYVPDSAKVTGTPNTGWHINNPDVKFDQTIGGNVFDTSTWQAAAVPVDGYTSKYGIDAITDQLPKNPESLHTTSPTSSRKGEFTFVYTKQPTKVTINYVDDDQGEKVVGTGTVNGKTGAEVTITPSLPKGYMLTPGKDTPSTYTVTDAANQAVTIHVQKQFVDTSATDPQAKQTRTVTLHYVYGEGDKQGQKAFDDAVLNVYCHRTATLDRATSKTTYGDWLWDQSQGDPSTPGYHVVSGKWTNLPQHWANVTADVPSIKGYHADLGQNDPANTNHVPANVWVYPTWNGAGSTGDTLDGYESKAYQTSAHLYEVQPEHTVKYMPNKTTLTVKFVDDHFVQFTDGHYLTQQVGQATTLTGQEGDTVDLNLTVPDKYQLADGQQLPTSYTFANSSNDMTIHLVHKVVQREATIDVRLRLLTEVHIDNNSDDIDVFSKTKWTPQLADEFKTADTDDLSYKLSLSSSVEAGTLTGHVNYDLVDEKVVSFGDDWTTLNLNGQTYQMPNGTDVVNGVTLEYNNRIIENLREDTLNILKWYQNLDPDYVNRPWHGYLSVNATNNNDLIGSVQQFGLQAGLAGDEPNALAKATGDRAAISVEMGNKTIDLSLLQGIHLDVGDFSEQNGQLRADKFLPVGGVYIPYVEKTATRTINVTMPDGKTTTVKQTATLAKQVVCEKDAHQNWTAGEWTSYDVPAIPGYTASQSNVAKETVTGETKDQTVNITYTANPQTTTVKYVDDQGEVVHTTTVDGVTNQTVKVPSEVPAGWTITKGQVPSEITFGADGHDPIEVTVAHQHVTVDPEHPQTNGTKLPDNPAKTFNGVEANDLNKTVTRTIKVTQPDGQTKTVTQTVKLTRSADVDEVTGKVTYGDWTTSEWAAYDVPSVAGYTPSQAKVDKETVTAASKDTTTVITYTPNQHQISVEYIDDDAHGKIVKTDQVPGKTDQTITVTPSVPANYDLVDNGDRTYVVTSGDGQAVQIHVKHHQVTTSESKAVTRTIDVHTPHNGVKTIKQTADLNRDVTTDQVTGEKTYGDWTTGQWEAYTPEAIPGYTPINQ